MSIQSNILNLFLAVKRNAHSKIFGGISCKCIYTGGLEPFVYIVLQIKYTNSCKPAIQDVTAQ